MLSSEFFDHMDVDPSFLEMLLAISMLGAYDLQEVSECDAL